MPKSILLILKSLAAGSSVCAVPAPAIIKKVPKTCCESRGGEDRNPFDSPPPPSPTHLQPCRVVAPFLRRRWRWWPLHGRHRSSYAAVGERIVIAEPKLAQLPPSLPPRRSSSRRCRRSFRRGAAESKPNRFEGIAINASPSYIYIYIYIYIYMEIER